ncbi:MAG: hypothetical protein ACLR8Y_18325 [Alistipes indistinctus]
MCRRGGALGNYDTRESLTREMLTTLCMHSRTMQTLAGLGALFCHSLRPILKKHGVPDDFKYLCMAESGLNPARSVLSLWGHWQLMPAYAKSSEPVGGRRGR